MPSRRNEICCRFRVFLSREAIETPRDLGESDVIESAQVQKKIGGGKGSLGRSDWSSKTTAATKWTGTKKGGSKGTGNLSLSLSHCLQRNSQLRSYSLAVTAKFILRLNSRILANSSFIASENSPSMMEKESQEVMSLHGFTYA